MQHKDEASVAVASVAVAIGNIRWAVMKVRLKNSDVYVNDLTRVGDRLNAHISYHASGQRHPKVGRNSILWGGGSSGEWERMKTQGSQPGSVVDREHVSTFLFDVARVPSMLKPTEKTTDMTVDASAFEETSVVGFQVSIIGALAESRTEIIGFPVIDRYRFTNGRIAVELEAFHITNEMADRPW